MRIAAVVVTYNRRELLQKTLHGLEAQKRRPDHLIIVDNASTDGTAEMLAQHPEVIPTTVVRMRTNRGGAGGFAAGINRAYGLGFDAFWLMDDDTVPRAMALHKLEDRLLAAAQDGPMPSFACSTVVWRDGSLCEMNTPVPTWDFPRPITAGHDYLSVQSCSFVSCLITRAGVHAVGLPYPEYFIWYDDAEYTQRLARFRPGIYVPGSVVDHLLATNRGVNYADVNADNIWKFEYGVRNQVSAAITLRRPAIIGSLAENMIRQLRGSQVPWKLRLRLLQAAWKGIGLRPKIRFAKTVS